MDIDGAQYSGIDNSTAQTPSLKMARLSSSRLAGERVVAEECAVALVYDGTTSAVLLRATVSAAGRNRCGMPSSHAPRCPPAERADMVLREQTLASGLMPNCAPEALEIQRSILRTAPE